MKVPLAEKMDVLQKLDREIQGIICAGESSQKVLTEDIEVAAKIRADMQEAVIAIDRIVSMVAGSSGTADETTDETTGSQGSSSMVSGASSQARLPKFEVKKFSG
mgnify:CR=1 FL=1